MKGGEGTRGTSKDQKGPEKIKIHRRREWLALSRHGTGHGVCGRVGEKVNQKKRGGRSPSQNATRRSREYIVSEGELT